MRRNPEVLNSARPPLALKQTRPIHHTRNNTINFAPIRNHCKHIDQHRADAILPHRDWLWNSMTHRCIITLNGHTGVINGLEMEDGSGRCFNVKISKDSGETITTFTRTR